MEQAWSTKFEQNPILSRPGLNSNSQLYLRNRKRVVLNSLCMIKGLSLHRRIAVTSIALSLTLKAKSQEWKCIPKALRTNVDDAYGNEAEVLKVDTVDGSLNMEDNQVTKEGVIISENGSKIVKPLQENGVQPLKWPLWLLGPTLLLVTGAIPTLWLPFSSIFSGSNMASLLALTGLDGIFNLGATFFLLMADFCARSKSGHVSHIRIPFGYKFWNFFLNLVGLVIPSLTIVASCKGLIQPQVGLLSFAAMLGPYLMLLLVQMSTEMLTWHWKSPVWLIVPVVYEAYRILQLTRGLDLGIDLSAPIWLMEGMKGLVAWWVLVLGMQLMRISWFVGRVHARQDT